MTFPKLTVFVYLTLILFPSILFGQEQIASATKEKEAATKTSENKPAEKKDLTDQKYRLLQSNEFLVKTAYLQEDGEVEHAVSFARTNRHNWSFNFEQQWPLRSGKHQFSLSIPTQIGKNHEGHRGVGDVEIEYNYALIGSRHSRVTVSPGFGVTLPTGKVSHHLSSGATGVSLKLPVSIMLTRRFASNTTIETIYTRRAKNIEGDHANLFGYEIGQSFVWFARPKLNFLVEAIYERSQAIGEHGIKETEKGLFISPGVRWAYTFRNGAKIVPGVAVPIGVGPSRGERGIFFYLAIEHPFKKRAE